MSATKFVNYLKAGFARVLALEYSTTLPVVADGERAVAQGDAGGRLMVSGKLHREITVVPVVSTAQYATGDHVGGKITFANALRLPALSGKLMSITVNCKTVQTNTLMLALFKADPSGTTFTDNAAAAIDAADFAKLIGIFTLGAANSKMGTHTTFLLDNINKAIQAAGSTLYAALINTTGTPTLGSVSDISVSIGIEQD
ncbi:MAG: hypothetical protein NTV97_03505 [Alphaproteobacteria bacterium]|nr:hypothetical protein [Alphaproteobacteria bacterium]